VLLVARTGAEEQGIDRLIDGSPPACAGRAGTVDPRSGSGGSQVQQKRKE
jgi:hypothetical protein